MNKRSFCRNFYCIQLILSILITSCITQKNLEYLHENQKKALSFDEVLIDDYILKPKDELYIQISSLDEAAANMFITTGAQQFTNVGTIQPYGASLLSYTIDKEGYVVLPVIGSIMVSGKTIRQVNELIIDSLANILSQPIVTIKLVNRYISVLGEVRNPGHYTFSQEKLSIYDAIAFAGDITEYGCRNEVILIRSEEGKNSRIPLDLTKSAMLSSEYYYLRPNDLIYVKPLGKRFWGLREFPYTVILSTITTGLLIYNVTK